MTETKRMDASNLFSFKVNYKSTCESNTKMEKLNRKISIILVADKLAKLSHVFGEN